MLLPVVSLVIITAHLGQNYIPLPSEDLLEQQLQQYLINYKLHTKKKYSFCNYVNINVHNDIANWIIKNNGCPTLIPNSSITGGHLHETDATFIFFKKKREINRIVKQMRSYPYWNSERENHFILCDRVENVEFLPRLTKIIWKLHILNFVVVLVTDRLQVFAYDPFQNEIIDLLRDQPNHENPFPDKLDNLNRYELRVSLTEQDPVLVKRKGVWQGKDYTVLKLITSIMNATFRIVEPTENDYFYESYNDVVNDRADFSFNSIFASSSAYISLVEETYPHAYDQLFVLIPISPKDFRKSSHNLFAIFTYPVWILIFLSMFIISIVVARTDKHTFLTVLLNNFSNLLGYSVRGFQKLCCTVKLQIITFLLGTIIIRTAFNSFLISSFISPNSVEWINTIGELRRSELVICVAQPMEIFVPKGYNLEGQLIIVSPKELAKKLYALDTSMAYIVTQNTAEIFLESAAYRKRPVPFYVLKEALAQGFDYYIFQKHSPYTRKVSELLLLERQFGLTNTMICGRTVHGNHSDTGNTIVLGMNHLRSIFYILIGGLMLATLVFILEVISVYGTSLVPTNFLRISTRT